VVYRGSVGPEERAEVLATAAVLLHPIHFDEPFGLSVVEAMASGTPVVAYRRGSMPEIIDEGITGFAVTVSTKPSRPCRARRRWTAHSCRSAPARDSMSIAWSTATSTCTRGFCGTRAISHSPQSTTAALSTYQQARRLHILGRVTVLTPILNPTPIRVPA
jgi:hypothetical protein